MVSPPQSPTLSRYSPLRGQPVGCPNLFQIRSRRICHAMASSDSSTGSGRGTREAGHPREAANWRGAREAGHPWFWGERRGSGTTQDTHTLAPSPALPTSGDRTGRQDRTHTHTHTQDTHPPASTLWRNGMPAPVIEIATDGVGGAGTTPSAMAWPRQRRRKSWWKAVVPHVVAVSLPSALPRLSHRLAPANARATPIP